MSNNTSRTFYLDDDTWQAFRMACLARKVSASTEIADMVRARVKEWGPLPSVPAVGKKPALVRKRAA